MTPIRNIANAKGTKNEGKRDVVLHEKDTTYMYMLCLLWAHITFPFIEMCLCIVTMTIYK